MILVQNRVYPALERVIVVAGILYRDAELQSIGRVLPVYRNRIE